MSSILKQKACEMGKPQLGFVKEKCKHWNLTNPMEKVFCFRSEIFKVNLTLKSAILMELTKTQRMKFFIRRNIVPLHMDKYKCTQYIYIGPGPLKHEMFILNRYDAF